ncbi:MAG TPA: XRE family transcriptional regulator [Candidatus Thioglobus sp.]|jgi:transcriptional regulator with XRE-family HTH domain|nr:XRE family transcriptional regulator [Candidatus Thioglobus sp.]
MSPPKKGVSIINKDLPSFGSEKQLEASIGRQVRNNRKRNGVTLQQLSKQSSLSPSMLSKIENGQISASLKTIQSICHALNISISSIFTHYETDVEATFVNSGNGLTIERGGTSSGRHYQLLGHTMSRSLKVEPCLITIDKSNYKFPEFQHKGVEFIYMLEGSMDYYYGKNIYRFNEGDSLYFDSDTPHGPKNIITKRCIFLAVICSTGDE